MRPTYFTIPYHTAITQYPVRGHDYAVNYKPQKKACLLSGHGIAKYEVLTAVLFGSKSPWILGCVDERVVTDVSKDRTLISKIKKTNVVNF